MIIGANSSNMEILIALIVASLATFITRFLPYAFLKNLTQNYWLRFLQKNSALFIMVVLIFYALNTTRSLYYPWAEILGILVALVVQILGKNALVSIAVSTILYMVVIRVF